MQIAFGRVHRKTSPKYSHYEASKAVYVSPELISESPFEYIQDVIKFGDL